MEKQDSSERKRTPWVLFIAIILVAVLDVYLVHLWWSATSFAAVSLKDIIDVVQKLMIGSAAVLAPIAGIEIPKILHGTPYYRHRYGRLRVRSILSPVLKEIKQGDNYRTLLVKINQIQNQPATNKGTYEGRPNSRYLEIVFRLQSLSPDFLKIWNDYNYCSLSNKLRFKRYMQDLERYVFCKVVEEDRNDTSEKPK